MNKTGRPAPAPLIPPHGKHSRRSIRLRGYDYSLAGAYYITIVTQDRAPIWGEVADGVMRLCDAGRMVEQAWLDLPARFPSVELDAFIVMPNHLHGIIVITDPDDSAVGDVGATLVVAQSGAAQSDDDCDTPKRAGTRPAPTTGDDVGATLVVAQGVVAQGVVAQSGAAQSDDDCDTPKRAGTRPAPTTGDDVGATLVVAQDVVAQSDVAQSDVAQSDDDCDTPKRAGTRPAPTTGDDVGATLVVAQGVVAQDVVAQGVVAQSDVAQSDDDCDTPKRAGTRPAPTTVGDVGATLVVAQDATNVTKRPTVGNIIGAFKSITTHAYIQGVHNHGWTEFRGRVWQRNYYEHIIRDDPALQRIRAYIDANPEQWATDRENPMATAPIPRP